MIAERNSSVDLLRFLAACSIVCIVWLHARAPNAPVAFTGLPVFIQISVALAVWQSLRGRFVEKVARRLMVPWVFWLVLSGSLSFVFEGQFFLEGDTLPEQILHGPRAHLCYIPSVFAGIAIGLSTRMKRKHRSIGLMLLCLGSGVVTLLFLSGDHASLVPRFLLSPIFTALAFAFPLRWARPARWLSDKCLGIYILHPFFMYYLLRVPILDRNRVGLAGCMMVVSLAVVWCMRSIPFRPIRMVVRAVV